ncbi:MAG: aminotransferase class I/II-fold pyridoxal phosphate-dependent enzyme [Alphaproteobacteria bacterium]|nr:aminotransferase class I/II-fold pyridoxal phosphate-dependent enzyme [Alphaproteobacteria bacterium]
MALKFSRRGGIPPFIVMDVMREANALQAAGRSVLHLEVGQPSTPAPAGVAAAARRALEEDVLGYTEAFGLPRLRERIARHYRDAYGVEVAPANIVACTGSSSGFVPAFLSAFAAGDRVALAVPGYPAYRNILTALDIEPVLVEVGPDTNFQPTPEVLDRVSGRLDGLIVASPANPTGTMIGREDLGRLAGYCRARGIRAVSDEIYHGIAYGAPAATILAFDPDAIVVNSFSKYFSMTGWRMGWMVLPDSLLRPVECLAQNLYISPPTLSQFAAAAAFDCAAELGANVARYAENRRLLLAELPKAGFDRLAPAEGAFYIYADVGALTNDSAEFCRRMLHETGVAATPGADFDPLRGNRFVRFSFAGATADMAEAARRLIGWKK